ncbi:MAG: hypothetical protein L3J75_12505 [Methylococcaceae bacterium]|nr:hypothetical protein [Methylococcaceae bacterium]
MEFSLWESLLLGVMVLGIIFWMRPGIKASMNVSRNAKSDWVGLLIPIGFVIMFVFFLVAMV